MKDTIKSLVTPFLSLVYENREDNRIQCPQCNSREFYIFDFSQVQCSACFLKITTYELIESQKKATI